MNMTLRENERQAIRLSDKVLEAAEAVHRRLGPEQPKAAYKDALRAEFEARGIVFESNVWLPEQHKGMILAGGYDVVFIVENRMLVEINARDVEKPLDELELLSHLRLSRYRLGLLIDFRKRVLQDGIKRLAYAESGISWV